MKRRTLEECNQHGKGLVIKIIRLYLNYYKKIEQEKTSKTFEKSDLSVKEENKREEVLNMLDNTLVI